MDVMINEYMDGRIQLVRFQKSRCIGINLSKSQANRLIAKHNLLGKNAPCDNEIVARFWREYNPENKTKYSQKIH